jgi:hypothetical protein
MADMRSDKSLLPTSKLLRSFAAAEPGIILRDLVSEAHRDRSLA